MKNDATFSHIFRKYSNNNESVSKKITSSWKQEADQEIQIKFCYYTTTEIYLMKRALVETLESFSKRTGFA